MTNRCLAVAMALLLLGSARAARADGAFPDEVHVFVPEDKPNEIIVAATFGLIESADNGQTWVYVCNPQDGPSSTLNLYQLGPNDTLLSDSVGGLFRSTDLGCSWTAAGGVLASAFVSDAAFDPNTPGVLLALSNPLDGGGPLGTGATAIFPSNDNGATFGAPVLTTPANLEGIELPVSSPGLVYAVGNEPHVDGGVAFFGNAFVLVGLDGGDSWGAPIDHPELNAALAGDAGPLVPPLIRLAQVDPVDPLTVYLRLTLTDSGQDFLAVTHDRGQTVQVLFAAPRPITAFLRAADNTLYVGMDEGLYAARPDGGPFQIVNQACADGGVPADGRCNIQVRAISERNGLLYVSANDFPPDDMALGTSADHGVHFTRLLNFVDISGLGCAGVETTCGSVWCGTPGLADGLVTLLGIDGGGCPGPDAGTATKTGGCNCGTAGSDGALLLALALLSRFTLRSRRARHPQAGGLQ